MAWSWEKKGSRTAGPKLGKAGVGFAQTVGQQTVVDTTPAGEPAPALVALSVRMLQMGLEQLHRQFPEIESPGAVDGVYGPRTEAALTSWAGISDAFGFGAVVPFEADHGSREVRTTRQVVDHFSRAAADYELAHPQGSGSALAPANDSSLAPTLTGPGSRWWLWLLLGLGAAAIGGLAYWYWKTQMRGRK